MIIKGLKAQSIRDTRRDKTILVKLKTEFGSFSASSPNGKSRGKFEALSWKKSLDEDIKTINNTKGFEIKFGKFNDLKNIEKIFKKKVGANTMIALEYCFLKALAKKRRCKIWQLINSRAKKMPMPIGNIIGGGSHSDGKKPDFQEFWIIPNTNSFYKANQILKRAHKNCFEILKSLDRNFKGVVNDENAWQTSFNNEQVISIILNVKDNMVDEFKETVHCGIDVAGSEFFRRGKYFYKNESQIRNKKEQIEFISQFLKEIYAIEDCLEQNDFKGFAEIKKKSKGLIIGDDLTATNLSRIKKAVKIKSINAVIIKPNQNGSLIEVKKIAEFCRKQKIKMIFSHRSGETKEDTLADLSFGFQADFIKTGVKGKGRDEKLNRLIEIEERL